MTSTPLPLPVLRLLLGVRADEPLTLPPFAGSMLRGALGHALLRQSPLPHDGNQPCALRESCTYCQVFRPLPTAEHTLQKFSALPAPYCIEPPFDAVRPAPRPLAPGQSFEFGLVLIGRAIAHLPALLAAFTSACQRGLDVRAGRASRCSLISARLEGSDTPFWQHGQPLPSSNTHSSMLSSPVYHTGNTSYTLRFITPLRLQLAGRIANARTLTARALLIALARRTQLLMDTQLGTGAPQFDFPTLCDAADTVQLDASALRWFGMQRYSSRQQRNTPLDGLLGTLRLHGDLSAFEPLLHLGGWLHVGKETVFGLGRYTLHAE